jgi:hypothetical protein
MERAHVHRLGIWRFPIIEANFMEHLCFLFSNLDSKVEGLCFHVVTRGLSHLGFHVPLIVLKGNMEGLSSNQRDLLK